MTLTWVNESVAQRRAIRTILRRTASVSSSGRLEDLDDVVLQCIGIGAENRLDTIADLDDTRGTETLQTVLIHLALVGDLHAQARDAGVDVDEVLPAAERRDDLLGLGVGASRRGLRLGRDSRSGRGNGSDGIGTVTEVRLFLRLEFGFRLTSRSSQIPLRDRKPEQHVIDNEEHDAHANEQRDVLRGWGRAI